MMDEKLAWHFAKPTHNQKQRESEAERFFMSDAGTDRAEDLVREGLQNSLDAHVEGMPPVEVRIRFGYLSSSVAAKYAKGLLPHVPVLVRHLPGLSDIQQGGAYLTFEDFNTKGLTGDERQQRRYDDDPPNAFHTFFRAEGKTDKAPGKLGSHGVGKIALMAASKAHTMIGLTKRSDDGRVLLFGTGVFRSHRLGNEDFECDAWFGLHKVLEISPTDDAETISQFRSDFGLARSAESGLSVVIPWLDQDEETGVTIDRIIAAILRGHAYPILRGELAVEVTSVEREPTRIDADSFGRVLAALADESLRRELAPTVELMRWALSNPILAKLGLHGKHSPTWSDPGLMTEEQKSALRNQFEAGEALAVRVPLMIRSKTGLQNESYFDVFMKREDNPISQSHSVIFLRRNLLIAGISKVVPGVRAIVTVDDDHVAEFVRRAENPSHTRVDAKGLKDLYSYAAQTLSFILGSPSGIARILTGAATEKDKQIWADDLSLPGGDIQGPGLGGPKAKRPGSPPPPPPPPAPKRPYRIEVTGGDVVVKSTGHLFDNLPARLELLLAYHVRGHDPLARWAREDFDFSQRKAAMRFTNRGCSIIQREGNLVVLRISSPEFEFRVSGFDTRRELFCKPRLTTESDMQGDGSETGADTVEISNEA